MKAARLRGFLRRWLFIAVWTIAWFYGLILLSLVALRWLNPPFTAVQVERRVEAWLGHKPYTRRYRPVAIENISPHLQHAVVAAEDGRFFQHHGFDWVEIEHAIDEEDERGYLRGASTLTQQLAKNLFLSTRRSTIRKGLEFTITPLVELVLPKKRILELYLNVIEWGPGIFGAEAAARFHYNISAARLTRDQAARLAAVLPSPLRRRPVRMDRYSASIEERMSKMGY